MSERNEDQKKNWNITGLAIPAGLLLGMGFGFWTDRITAGIFIGLGGGFLVSMIAMIVLRLKG